MFKSQTQRFSFYKNGESGRGVASTKARYYLSTSKTSPTGGSWSYTAPSWEKGKYLWIREEITYTDGDVVFTEPYCDSSWEAVNEVDKQILAWCMENDRTYINGAKIFTGTITADKLKVDSLESIVAKIGGIDISEGDLVCHVVCDEEEGCWTDGSTARGYEISDGGYILLYTEWDGTEEEEPYFASAQMSLEGNGAYIEYNMGEDFGVLSSSFGYDSIIFSYENGIDDTYVYKGARIGIGYEDYGALDIEATDSINFHSKTMTFTNIEGETSNLIITKGETWTTGAFNSGGYVSSSRKIVYFTVPVGPRMVGVKSVKCTSLKMNIRVVEGGYVGEGYVEGGYDYCKNSNYTITCYPRPNTNTLSIRVEQNVTYGTTNNTPISIDISSATFVFS